MNSKPSFLSIIILAIGFILAGFFPGYYYYKAKMDNRSVTVKGLAELDVIADLAIWEIKYTTNGKELDITQKALEDNKKLVIEYLKNQNFSDSEISIGRINTNDLQANPYNQPQNPNSRFILTQSVFVYSKQVNAVEKALSDIGELVSKGVIFNNQEYSSPVSYIFTKLNEIKPQMLQEATKNAKTAAQEFAKNSDTKVGKIKTANQGVFSILPKDASNNAGEANYINKKIRVVSTITYYLD